MAADPDAGDTQWPGPLAGDDLAVLRRLAARLAADDRSPRPGRTLRSILEQLLGMDQSGLEAVVSLYNTTTPQGRRTQQVDPFIAAMSYNVMSPRAKGLSLDAGDCPVASGSASSRDARACSPATPGLPGQRVPGTSAALSPRAASIWESVLGHAHGAPPAMPPPGKVAQLPGLPSPKGSVLDAPALADGPTGDSQASRATSPVLEPPGAAASADDGRPVTEAGSAEPGSADLSVPMTARYCTVCLLWLNGPKQFVGHQLGRDHRRWEAVGGKQGPIPVGAPARDGAGALDLGGAAAPGLPEPDAGTGAPDGRQFQ